MTSRPYLTQPELGGLTDALRGSELTTWDFVRAAIILGASIVVARVARFVVARVLLRHRTDRFLVDLVGRSVGYLSVLFGSIYALDSLGVAIGPLLGALGIVGFALAFALQDVAENFVAGVIIQATRPFGATDEISTGDHEGAVVAVDARTITMETPDGETVHVPSADVIRTPIINHTELGQRRSTIEVGVAYGTDLDRARLVAVDATRALTSVHAEPQPEALLFQFGASSIDIAVRFWHGATIAEKWEARNDVILAIDKAFKADGITIPFPQRTVHLPPSI